MERAAEVICNGGLVAVPTETVYGLAADGLNENAVKEILERKEELFGYMDDFLNTIKTFDNAA